jgi:hypothetical protein
LQSYKDLLYSFKIVVEGDSSANWLDATWEDRPVNNYWWVDDPNNSPTDFRILFIRAFTSTRMLAYVWPISQFLMVQRLSKER